MESDGKPEKDDTPRRERGAITVHQALREEILTLVREPGSGLDEVSIAKTFNLSRTPVREAIFMLSGEGLVKVLPNRTSIVTPLSMHRLNDLLDTWLILTRSVCVHAAHRRTPEGIADLRARLAAFGATIGGGDMLATALAMLELQRGYAEVARNFFLSRYYPDCLDAGRRTLLLHYFPYASSSKLELQARFHAALIDAIDRDDVAACNTIAGDMIAAILKVIRASLEPTAANQVDLSTAPLA
ncbi:GntR family transcriptional regulator [Maritimibacter fusiformis]|uniref:GntR family transcriptional regulator n=1 Tax=Maritimibacter fusiformis TaxID=2603819 RepID=A0A5D0RNU8_9RHOB|nr:GntR family transcriptional regulator [Maritimibacter fusiformis]TYB82254.1 GntR family transcriptional regulator [Maritimibacter fusiformis]